MTLPPVSGSRATGAGPTPAQPVNPSHASIRRTRPAAIVLRQDSVHPLPPLGTAASPPGRPRSRAHCPRRAPRPAARRALEPDHVDVDTRYSANRDSSSARWTAATRSPYSWRAVGAGRHSVAVTVASAWMTACRTTRRWCAFEAFDALNAQQAPVGRNGTDRHGRRWHRFGRMLDYWMISSARASTAGGIVRPICFAAFRLMMNSNFVGCSMGRSAGLAPLRILSTNVAARRSISVMLAL